MAGVIAGMDSWHHCWNELLTSLLEWTAGIITGMDG